MCILEKGTGMIQRDLSFQFDNQATINKAFVSDHVQMRLTLLTVKGLTVQFYVCIRTCNVMCSYDTHVQSLFPSLSHFWDK